MVGKIWKTRPIMIDLHIHHKNILMVMVYLGSYVNLIPKRIWEYFGEPILEPTPYNISLVDCTKMDTLCTWRGV